MYGISVDTFFTLKAFQDQQKLTFPLLSDFNKQVIRDYGVFNEDMIGLKGIAKRAVFVIDKDGVVRTRRDAESRLRRAAAQRAGLRGKVLQGARIASKAAPGLRGPRRLGARRRGLADAGSGARGAASAGPRLCAPAVPQPLAPQPHSPAPNP